MSGYFSSMMKSCSPQLSGRRSSALGYEVTTVAGGVDAWRVFLGNPARFDLVITDQTMPGMTGTVLAEKILGVRKEMPVILCTGLSDAVSPEQAETLGIRAFVVKPFVRAELARTIRRVLDPGAPGKER